MVGIGAYNTLASKICVKLFKLPNILIPNTQHFLSDLLTHSKFHSMLFSLPGYQFPYIVMNRCLYLSIFLLAGPTLGVWDPVWTTVNFREGGCELIISGKLRWTTLRSSKVIDSRPTSSFPKNTPIMQIPLH
jgi:hypothetical protein